MRNLLLVACLTSLSIFSYAQCTVNVATEAAVRAAVTNLNNGTCPTITVNAVLAGLTVTITNNPIDLTSNSGTVKTLNLSGLTLRSTANIDGVIRVTNGANNYTLTNITINRAKRNGIHVQASNNIIIQNSTIYEAAQDVGQGFTAGDTVGGWTGVVNYGYVIGRGDLYSGIFLENTVNNFTIRNNTVSGNNGNGIRVYSNNGTGTRLITGNRVGVTANGNEPYGNFGEGILIEQSQRVTITNNHIAANGNHSAWTNDASISGLDPKTDKDAGVQASYLLGSGIELRTGSNHIVQGNFVGTNKDGSSIVSGLGKTFGNHKIGIYIKGSSNNLIGGSADGQENIVGGNGYAFENNHTSDSNPTASLYYYGVLHGIQIHGTGANSNDNRIFGNYVGWYNGNCIPNRQDGISLIGYDGTRQVRGNSIGGANAGEGNVIGGGQYGIFLQSEQVTLNNVLGNMIGTDGDNCNSINCSPNIAGIKMQSGSVNNQIGTVAAPNIISNIIGNAVEVDGISSVDNTIQGNKMCCNNGGIILSGTGNENYAANAVSINVPTSTATHIEGFTAAPTDRIDVYIADTSCGASINDLCQNGGTQEGVQGFKWVTSVTAQVDTRFTPQQAGYWELEITPELAALGLKYENMLVTATETGDGSTSGFNAFCGDLRVCTTPTRPVITPSAPGFCPGQSVILTTPVVTGHQYTWYRGSVSAANKIAGGSGSTLNQITVTQGGSYFVKIASVIDTNTCFNTSLATTITAYSNPTPPSIIGNDIVCTESTMDYSAANTTFASYTWSFDPATNTNPVLGITSGTVPNQVSVNFGTATGTRTLRLNVTSAQGCSSAAPATKVITIREKPTVGSANVSASQICATNTLTLTGNPINAWETGVWSGNSGIVQQPNSTNATVSNLSAGNYTFRYTVSNGGTCANAIKDFPVKVDGIPTPSVVGADKDVCSSSVPLSGNTVALPNTGQWISNRPGVVTFNDNTSPTATASNLPVGVTRFIWEVSNGVCAKSRDTMFVTRVADLTIANAGVDKTICAGTPVTLIGSTPKVGETVLWENLDNRGSLSSTNNDTTEVTGLMATANYRYTVSNGVCTNSSDQVRVIVQQPATATIIDPVEYVKQINTNGGAIEGNQVTGYTGAWLKTKGIGSITGVTASTSVDGLFNDGDSIFVRWTLTDNLNVCPTTSDSAVVTRTDVTQINFTRDSLCESATYGILRGPLPNTAKGEVAQWVVASSDDFTAGANSSEIIPDFSNGPGTYTYVYQITNTNTNAISSGTKIIVVNENPSPAKISDDDVICESTYALEAQEITVGTGAWTTLSAQGSNLTSIVSLTPTIQNIGAGTAVSYIWSVKNGVCPINRDTVTITRTRELTKANPTVVSEDTLCEGSTARVIGALPNTTITPNETGLWSVVQGTATIANPTSNQTDVTGLGVGVNILKYKIGNGVCTGDSANVTIVIDEKPDTARINGNNALVICDDEYPLTAEDPKFGNGLWTTTNTSVGITTPDSSSTLVTNLPEGGEVTFTWTVSSDLKKCINPPATVKIARSLDLTIADAGANQLLCNGEEVKLEGKPKKPTETSEWKKVPVSAGVAFSSATNSASTLVTGLPIGLHKFYYTIRNGVCNDAIDSVTVDIKPLPTALDITAASDTLVCASAGSTGEFFATGTNVGSFIWTLPAGATEQTASANKDQITVSFPEGTTSQKIYVRAVSEFDCPSATGDSLLVKRLVIPRPQVDQSGGSCPGIDKILSITNAMDGITYTWAATPDSIKGSKVGTSVTVVTPSDDYPVEITASSQSITCTVSMMETIIVSELLTGVDISGLISDLAGVKCDSDDERFDSTRVLRANITTNDTDPDVKYTWSHTFEGNTDFPPNNNIDSLLWSFSKAYGQHVFKVLVENNKCTGDLDSGYASINLVRSVPVDYKLSAVLRACAKDTAILGVRDIINNVPNNRGKVEYDWYHNQYVINTDLEVHLGSFDSLEVIQKEMTGDFFPTVLNKDKTFKHYDTTYIGLIGGNQISYDNYKIYGVLGEKIGVKATPEFCIIYDKVDSTKGEFLLWDTINTTDNVVLARPDAVATAFDLNTMNGITVEALIDANGYIIEYDQLNMDKVEDRFALYDITNKGSVTPEPLTRNWYQINEDGSLGQADITSNKEILAFPIPKNRPEVIEYMLKRDNGVCADSDYVEVRINYLPWPPNAFSPNGDGFYDTWEITNVDKYVGTTVTIFNRWGSELVQIKDYHLKENWWDGTKGGTPLPTGAYFYLVDFNNGTDPITGAVSLVK